MIKLFLFTTVLLFLSAATGCVVVPKHDNGKHKGWYKKPNNAKTKNPGKGNKKFYRVNAFAPAE